jgi:hypothetical protein
MNLKVVIICFSFFSLLSCKEKTKDNSKYKKYIYALESSLNNVDSLHKTYSAINFDSLLAINKLAKQNYKSSQKLHKNDTVLNINYENTMVMYKALFIKKLKNISITKSRIDKEYLKSNKQTKALIDNLIHETFEEDTASIYFNSESEALLFLGKEIDIYNSTANKAFNMYDSINNSLDSLNKLYIEKSN